MWDELPEEAKLKYQKRMLGFIALSPLFNQKNMNGPVEQCFPYVSSKFQEKAFGDAFGARIVDIGNIPYDATLKIKEAPEKTYLIGIKTFRVDNKNNKNNKNNDTFSDFEKIEQFKGKEYDLKKYKDEIEKILSNEDHDPSEEKIKNQVIDIYRKAAAEISKFRNDRLSSCKNDVIGFNGYETSKQGSVVAVYHVLMRSVEDGKSMVKVGEVSYDEIDVSNIDEINYTDKNKRGRLNFTFTDGSHEYRYTWSDCQLHMNFCGPKGVEIKDTWEAKFVPHPDQYLDDIYAEAFNEKAEDKPRGAESSALNSVFNDSGNVARQSAANFEDWQGKEYPVSKQPVVTESYTFPLTKNGKVARYSGLNGFFGVGSKLNKSERKKRLESIKGEYSNQVEADLLSEIMDKTEEFLLKDAGNKAEKLMKKELRQEILDLAIKTNNQKFMIEIERLVFRPMDEMYIPIRGSKEFHLSHPDFFAKGAGQFIEGTNKLSSKRSDRTFEMVFEPSGDMIPCYITQDGGKAIQSCERQEILGKWMLRGVFQLKEYEPLTAEKLNKLGIRGYRLFKTNADDCVHFEFIRTE